MNWDDLRIFLTLARCQTLSEAGRRLGIDHATVARRVKSLEAAMEAQLFERGPSGYAITTSGVDLMRYAEQMEAVTIAAENTIVDQSEPLSGAVRVACPEGVAAFALVDVAHDLCRAHPRLTIELLTNTQRYSLAKREADFVISFSRPERGRVKIQKISDVYMHFYGAQSYLEGRPEIKTSEDLARHRGIAFVPDQIPEKELDYRREVETELEAHIAATGVHVQQAAIVKGAGIGVMHDFMADAHPDLVRLLPDQLSIKRTLWGLTHQDQETVRRVQIVSAAMITHLRKALRPFDKSL